MKYAPGKCWKNLLEALIGCPYLSNGTKTSFCENRTIQLFSQKTPS